MAKQLTRARLSRAEQPNSVRQRIITDENLPLHCPMPGSSLWNSHPRIFLPIEDAPGQKIRCPYCGTVYILRQGPSR